MHQYLRIFLNKRTVRIELFVIFQIERTIAFPGSRAKCGKTILDCPHPLRDKLPL